MLVAYLLVSTLLNLGFAIVWTKKDWHNFLIKFTYTVMFLWSFFFLLLELGYIVKAN